MSDVDIEEIRLLTKKGLSELLEQAHLEPDDLFVLGLSTSEVQGKMIGKHSNIEIGRTIVKTIIETLKPSGVHLAVQGCEHLNRALVVEKAVAKAKGLEIVSVFPQINAGGAGQIAAFENFTDPVEVEHVVANVQVPVRTSVKEIGQAHVTYLRSRPKYIGGPRAKYEWDPFNEK